MLWLPAYLTFFLHVAARTSPQQLASQYSLTTSTSFPAPTVILTPDHTHLFMHSNWNLCPDFVVNGPEHLEFVDDPFPDSGVTTTTKDAVLRVTYEGGSYTPKGGAQLYTQWDPTEEDGANLQTALLTYEVAFPDDFDWVRGGKLPGLRGGPDLLGCNGGRQPNGSDCFSMRLMWREAGVGEVYAYVLRSNHICLNRNVTCSPEFGASIQRGAFNFTVGGWNRITMLVQLNSPGKPNGHVLLYFNDNLVIEQGEIFYRTSSAVNIGGLFFSTFFGGHSSSWATPVTTRSYFRNIRLWGST